MRLDEWEVTIQKIVDECKQEEPFIARRGRRDRIVLRDAQDLAAKLNGTRSADLASERLWTLRDRSIGVRNPTETASQQEPSKPRSSWNGSPGF